MSDYFKQVSPESVGIPSEAILEFIKDTARHGIEMHSFAVLRHGKCAAKGWWSPYNKELYQPVFSFSKSLTSTAIGFARQEGKLSLSEKLVSIFPENLPGQMNENLLTCTIRDLLVMGCGQETEVYRYDTTKNDGWLDAFFAHSFRYKPGTMFQYNTLGSNVLAAIISKKTGMQLTEYLRPRLLDPLGISKISCARLPDNTEMGGAGYRMLTEDMMKFGQFLLQKGMWEGRQLLEEEWFDEATTKQIETTGGVYLSEGDWAMGYGYQFWRCKDRQAYRADGAFGQFAVVLPHKDAVVIITSSSDQTQAILDCIWRLTDRMMEGVLPENEQNYRVLTETVCELKIPESLCVRNKKIERILSGKRYETEEYCPSFLEMIGGCGLFDVAYEDSCKSILFTFLDDRVIVEGCGEKTKLRIEAGMAGDYLHTDADARKFEAIARFIDHKVLEVIIRNMDSMSGTRFRFTFQEEYLLIKLSSTIVSDSGLIEVVDNIPCFKKDGK